MPGWMVVSLERGALPLLVNSRLEVQGMKEGQENAGS